MRRKIIVAACATMLLSGCATYYVDSGLNDVRSADYHRAQTSGPVHVQFLFETNGTPNPTATNLLRGDVVSVIAESGLFSSVNAAPATSGGVMNITIDDVGNRSAAFAKGFATGLTLGLAGSSVADHYTCTIEYSPTPGASSSIIKTSNSAIYTTQGAHTAPQNAMEVPTLLDAVNTMVSRVVGNTLKEVAADPTAKL